MMKLHSIFRNARVSAYGRCRSPYPGFGLLGF